MESRIGIVSAAVTLPLGKREASSLLAEESASATPEIAARLGVQEVPICNGESASAMALATCQEALQRAELDPGQVDVIVDYTILPQEYLVPAWNMSNKLQHELGAKKAFTAGFSGGGSTNLLVALSAATAMLNANEKLSSALLVAADVTIPGNRVLNPADPVSILGDSAGAMVLKKGVTNQIVLETELHSEGSYHDVCYIPGGALMHPDDPALYRMELDKARYDQAPKAETLRNMLETLLARAGVKREQVTFALYPNISSADQQEFAQILGFDAGQIDTSDRKSHGHLQGTDFVVNYLTMVEKAGVETGSYFIAASHGMGFLYGISLLRM